MTWFVSGKSGLGLNDHIVKVRGAMSSWLQ